MGYVGYWMGYLVFRRGYIEYLMGYVVFWRGYHVDLHPTHTAVEGG